MVSFLLQHKKEPELLEQGDIYFFYRSKQVAKVILKAITSKNVPPESRYLVGFFRGAIGGRTNYSLW